MKKYIVITAGDKPDECGISTIDGNDECDALVNFLKEREDLDIVNNEDDWHDAAMLIDSLPIGFIPLDEVLDNSGVPEWFYFLDDIQVNFEQE